MKRNDEMEKIAQAFRLCVLLIMSMAMAGCAMLGIVFRVPILEVRNDTVSASADADITTTILAAAAARKWVATVTAPDVVRCKFSASSWNIEVDVRHIGPVFSIEYVSSEGLFYQPESRTIHGTYNRQVEALRQRIKREAIRSSPAPSVVKAAAPNPGMAVNAVAKPYTIESFVREAGDGFSYRFVLVLTDAAAADMALSRRIQSDLREAVRTDCAASSGVKDSASLRVEFPQYEIHDGKVEGRAVVMAVELLEFVYDPVTKQGRLAVKVNPRQYDQTRQWVRTNIATLARDKDSGLMNTFAGRSRFSIGREVLRDDNVLEVEFKVGE